MSALVAAVYGSVGAFAGWTLLIWIAVAMGWTPAQFQAWAWGVVVGVLFCGGLSATLATRVARRFVQRPPEPATSDQPWTGPGMVSFVLAAVAVLAWFLTANLSVFWLLMAAALVPLARELGGPGLPVPVTAPLSWQEWLLLSALAVLCWLVNASYTGGAGDDAHFLDAAASFLVEPHLPLFAVDTLLQRYDQPNYVYALNLGQSGEALSGFLSRATGLDLLFIYYSVVPAAVSALTVLSWTLFGKCCGLRAVLPGVALSLLVLFAMSELDGNMISKYLNARQYHGKGALILVGLPLCWLTGWWAATNRDRASWTLLAILLVAVAGTSSTGLYMGPMAAGLGVLLGTGLAPRPLIQAGGWLFVASVPCIVALLFFHVLGPTGELEIRTDGFRRQPILRKFGGGWKGSVQIAAFYLILYATLIVGLWRRHTILKRLALIGLLLIMNPWLPTWLADLSGIDNLHWRFYWLTPLGFALTVTVAGLLDRAGPGARAGQGRPRHGATPLRWSWLAVAALAFVLSARYVIGLELKGAKPALHLRKVPPAIEALVDHFHVELGQAQDADLIVIAPPRISGTMNHLPHAPRQLYVLRYYLRLNPEISARDAKATRRIMNLMARDELDREQLQQLLRLIRPFGVSHVVFNQSQVLGMAPDIAALGLQCVTLRHFLVCEDSGGAGRGSR